MSQQLYVYGLSEFFKALHEGGIGTKVMFTVTDVTPKHLRLKGIIASQANTNIPVSVRLWVDEVEFNLFNLIGK